MIVWDLATLRERSRISDRQSSIDGIRGMITLDLTPSGKYLAVFSTGRLVGIGLDPPRSRALL